MRIIKHSLNNVTMSFETQVSFFLDKKSLQTENYFILFFKWWLYIMIIAVEKIVTFILLVNTYDTKLCRAGDFYKS